MRLLILGTGSMAAAHVQHFSRIADVSIVAAVDIKPDRLATFCETHGIPRAFPTLDEALSWGAFDAVANVTPDALHHGTTLAAIAAGKHVLCEKPLATNYAHAREMADAADAAGLVGMVNLTYRNVPELQQARQLVLDGAIGDVKHVDAAYLQSWLVARNWGDWRSDDRWLWRLSRQHGSNGVLGDLGVHLADLATYGSGQDIVAVTGRLRTFAKAEGDRIGEYQLDANDSFAMSVAFANGAIGVLHSSRWATGHANSLNLRIYGDRGGIELHHGTDGSTLFLCAGEDVHTQTWRAVPVDPVPTNYQRFAEAVKTGTPAEPSFHMAAKLQRVLDASASFMSYQNDNVIVAGEAVGSAAAGTTSVQHDAVIESMAV